MRMFVRGGVRYKLLMPAVASLPLLCSYRGVTAVREHARGAWATAEQRACPTHACARVQVVVPHALRSLLAVQADGGPLTTFGGWIDAVVTVDVASRGALLHLGVFARCARARSSSEYGRLDRRFEQGSGTLRTWG